MERKRREYGIGENRQTKVCLDRLVGHDGTLDVPLRSLLLHTCTTIAVMSMSRR